MTTYLKNDGFPLWKIKMGNILKEKTSYTIFVLASDALEASKAALEFQNIDIGYTEIEDSVLAVELVTVTIIDNIPLNFLLGT